MLCISRATFYRLLRRGDFPVVRVGHSPRVPVTALRSWIESQVSSPGPRDEVRSR